MSKKPVDGIEVGDLVRLHLVVPTRPWNARTFTSPFCYPGEATHITGRTHRLTRETTRMRS